MPLHLIKLCVGVDHPDQLTAWGRAERGRGRECLVHTRQTPRRAAEIEDGGSLYWVIKGVVMARQQVLSIDSHGEGAARRCRILLADEVIRTAPLARRPFQGWRYLDPREAPFDLTTGSADGLPTELAEELRALGAW